MNGWRSGDVVSAGAGLVALVGAASPWIVGDAGGIVPDSRPMGLLSIVLASGAALLLFGLARTSWTGLVALVGGLSLGVAVFSASVPAHAAGVHPGYGLFAVSLGAVSAMIGGVLNAIERGGGAL